MHACQHSTMPPKKHKAKPSAATEAAVAVDTAAPVADAASPLVSPLTLTPDGIEQLRVLSRHRPHRLAVGGVGVAIVSHVEAAVIQPPPSPVTLQIVQIQRCQTPHTAHRTERGSRVNDEQQQIKSRLMQ